MSIDYSTQIKPEVLHNLDLDGADAEAESKYQILESANAAQRSILRNVPISQVDNIIKTVVGKLLNGVPYYAWPSDYIRLKKMWVDFVNSITDSNLGKPVTFTEGGQFVVNSIDKAASTYNPKMYYVDGGFEIRPMPTIDVVDGYQLAYIYNPPDISTTQPSLLRDDLKNALIFKASELASLKGGNRPNEAEKYGTLFRDELVSFWQNDKESKNGRT